MVQDSFLAQPDALAAVNVSVVESYRRPAVVQDLGQTVAQKRLTLGRVGCRGYPTIASKSSPNSSPYGTSTTGGHSPCSVHTRPAIRS